MEHGKMKNITFKQLKKVLTESQNWEDIIPPEANVDPEAVWHKGFDPRVWAYFGDCKNTVDVDEMWDATEMASFLYQCDLFDVKKAIPCLQTGNRELPKKLMNWLKKSKDKLDDLGEVVCGMSEYHRIGFIYISDFDTHYFFDLVF